MDQTDRLPVPRPAGVVDAAEGGESARAREALREGQFGEAAEWFERAVGRDLTGAALDDCMGLAEARLWEGRHADVEWVCRGVLARDPSHRDARTLLGIALAHLDRPADAIGLLSKAPDHPAAHVGLALALDRIGHFPQAESAARRALAVAPGYPAALRLLGSILAHQRRHGEALSALAKAMKLDPDDASARLDRARVRIALGHPDAWPEVDWRFRVRGYTPAFPAVGPAWDGSSPAGKTLLLIAEPEACDQFLFLGFAPLLKRAGARVILACPPETAAVLSRAEGVDRVVTDTAGLGEAVDAHAYLMSLPGLLPDAPAAPSRAPYLHAEPALAARWAAEVAALPGAYQVAVHWSGGPADRRSIPLHEFARLASVPGVNLIAVQKGPGAEEARSAGFPLTDLGPRLDNGPSAFADTAALLMAVDLLVTNDSALAHLAGGLGVPAWVALPVGPDWRWMADRHDTPWYPSLSLFRQTHPGDWSSVFAAMLPKLRAGVACRSSTLRSA